MEKSLPLNSDRISMLAEKIVHARKLYGTDSSYIIGLITSIEWLLEGIEGGETTKRLLRDRILKFESGKPSKGPEEGGEVSEKKTNDLPEDTWIKGIVKWFNDDKGYGFISTESDSDVFVHWRDISSWDRSLSQGDEVEFMVTKTAKGFQAVNVMKAGLEEKKTTEGGESGQADTEGPDGEIETADTPHPEAVEGQDSETGDEETGEPASEDSQENSGQPA